jgi:hypothetical protein
MNAELARLEDEERMLQQPSTFQELLWGAWDGFDMHSALLDPVYIPPVTGTQQFAAKHLGSNSNAFSIDSLRF